MLLDNRVQSFSVSLGAEGNFRKFLSFLQLLFSRNPHMFTVEALVRALVHQKLGDVLRIVGARVFDDFLGLAIYLRVLDLAEGRGRLGVAVVVEAVEDSGIVPAVGRVDLGREGALAHLFFVNFFLLLQEVLLVVKELIVEALLDRDGQVLGGVHWRTDELRLVGIVFFFDLHGLHALRDGVVVKAVEGVSSEGG